MQPAACIGTPVTKVEKWLVVAVTWVESATVASRIEYSAEPVGAV